MDKETTDLLDGIEIPRDIEKLAYKASHGRKEGNLIAVAYVTDGMFKLLLTSLGIAGDFIKENAEMGISQKEEERLKDVRERQLVYSFLAFLRIPMEFCMLNRNYRGKAGSRGIDKEGLGPVYNRVAYIYHTVRESAKKSGVWYEPKDPFSLQGLFLFFERDEELGEYIRKGYDLKE